MTFRNAVIWAGIVALAFTAGCGGNAAPAPVASTTVSATATHEAMWQASLVDLNATNGQRSVRGQVTIDGDNQSGNGSYQFTAPLTNAAYEVQYCYVPVSSATCHLMVASTTDASGHANGSFVIPTSEPWLDGVPYESVSVVVAFAGTQTLITAWSPTDATSSYSTPLYKTIGQTDQPPTSGRFTVTGNQVRIQVRGAIPNTTYTAAFIQELGADGGGTLGTLSTDAAGNADANFVVSLAGFGVDLTPGIGGDLVDGVRTR